MRKAKIANHRRSVVIEQNVCGFQIAMEHAALVCEVNRISNLREHRSGVAISQRYFPARERPDGKLHREKRASLEFADGIDGHNIRVLEPRLRLRLHAESPHVIGPGPISGGEHLESDLAVQPFLPRAPHHAHPAATDLLDQIVASESAHHFLFRLRFIHRPSLQRAGEQARCAQSPRERRAAAWAIRGCAGHRSVIDDGFQKESFPVPQITVAALVVERSAFGVEWCALHV